MFDMKNVVSPSLHHPVEHSRNIRDLNNLDTKKFSKSGMRRSEHKPTRTLGVNCGRINQIIIRHVKILISFYVVYSSKGSG